MMARETRMAGFDPSNAIAIQAPPTAVQVAGVNTLAFIADVTGDLVSDQVVYRLTGDRLIRELASWSGSGWTAPAVNEVADHVTALAFRYFDATGAPTATLASIRLVQISLSTRERTGGRMQAYTLVTDVQVKSMVP